MANTDAQLEGSITVIMDYKKGLLTAEQAIDRFRKLTGLNYEIAKTFLKGMSRENVVSLQAKKSVLESKQTQE
jgi:hypothetical protein